jgi:hypothetical protein
VAHVKAAGELAGSWWKLLQINRIGCASHGDPFASRQATPVNSRRKGQLSGSPGKNGRPIAIRRISISRRIEVRGVFRYPLEGDQACRTKVQALIADGTTYPVR